MRLIQEKQLNYADVSLLPQRSKLSSRNDVNLIRQFTGLNSDRKLGGVPIFAANMDTVGTFEMATAFYEYQMFVALHKFYTAKELVSWFTKPESEYSFYTLGITNNDINKLKEVSSQVTLSRICIDVANGYMQTFVEVVASIRALLPTAFIMAGNVVTSEMVQELLLVGKADCVKIGISNGGACTTKYITGINRPSFSTVVDCSNTAHGIGGLICADGGIKNPGDICKAFGAGADMVMAGTIFSGHDECNGEWAYEYETKPDVLGIPVLTGNKIKKSMKFYGMSSKEAQDKYNGGLSDYRASEGACIDTPYKGPVKNTIQQILGGLRSCGSYIGANSLKDFSKCATFIYN